MRYLFLLVFFSFPAFPFENCREQGLNKMEECSYNNYKEEDSKLNYIYKEIVNTYPQLEGKVKGTQKLWVKARDNICEYDLSDGEEYKVYQNSCLYEQTYERNRELKAIILKQSSLKSNNATSSNLLWSEYLKSHCEFMKEKYSDNDCMIRNNFLHLRE